MLDFVLDPISWLGVSDRDLTVLKVMSHFISMLYNGECSRLVVYARSM